jgi:PTS system galactitol-specific IIC component
MKRTILSMALLMGVLGVNAQQTVQFQTACHPEDVKHYDTKTLRERFVMVLPYTKGNVVKTFIVGLVAVTIGLYFVTDMAPAFTLAANTVFEATQDKAAQIPDGFQAGAMDFASSLFGYVIYACVKYLQWIGMGVLTLITIAMVVWNRMRIVKEEQQ